MPCTHPRLAFSPPLFVLYFGECLSQRNETMVHLISDKKAVLKCNLTRDSDKLVYLIRVQGDETVLLKFSSNDGKL